MERKFKSFFQSFFYRLGVLFFQGLALFSHREPLDKDFISRILIIKLAAIGDVLFATPVARVLRENFPKARIDWLSESWTKEVLENNSHLNEIIVYDVSWHRPNKKGWLRDTVQLIKRLRRERYHLAVIIHRSPLAGLLAWMSGIHYRLGFDSEGKGFTLTTKVSYEPSLPEIRRNLELLRPLGIASKDVQMEMGYTSKDEAFASALLLRHGASADDLIVGLGPGGAKNPGMTLHHKRWPKENFARIGDDLAREQRARVVIFGGPDEASLAQEVATEMKAEAVVAAGETDLKQSAALLSKCHLYIGNDSGPLYMAAAVGTPTVGIYGPSDPRLVAPIGENHRYIWKHISCSPCYHPMSVYDFDASECPDPKCIKEITVGEVLEAARELLSERKVPK